MAGLVELFLAVGTHVLLAPRVGPLVEVHVANLEGGGGMKKNLKIREIFNRAGKKLIILNDLSLIRELKT